MICTRRDVGRIALAGLPAAGLLSASKPNSEFGGVQIGVIAPYSFLENDRLPVCFLQAPS
jgi:hypothetical protein